MAPECQIDVRFFAAPDDLAGCFTTLYRLNTIVPGGGEVEDYLQPEWANLRFFPRNPQVVAFDGEEPLEGIRFVATGPSSRPARFCLGTTRLWGIGLLPLGWARFVGVPAERWANRVVDGCAEPDFARFAPLLDIFADADADDEEQFDRAVAFLRSLAPAPRDAARIQRIHAAMTDPHLLTVDEFAASAGVSKRTLERCCARDFGFPPRLLLRRQRMMRSLAAFMLSPDANWSEVIDRHYHDQAHFVHEFHAFMGTSPSQYVGSDHPILTAFMAERQRVWGSPAQTLDRPDVGTISGGKALT